MTIDAKMFDFHVYADGRIKLTMDTKGLDTPLAVPPTPRHPSSRAPRRRRD